ncbi:sigma-70 family RNA polymerase sigma factor [Streptomyces sp. MK5]|uniref:sigma-70 family RNA polymerase sigma factor n=1 Tax=Streptomyces sp. MK5 TaxID=3064253 RepID=UPI00274238EE|nr:sigma-70 family RNA polymerase sigma factor [Streptomyces sp. MK5]
MSRAALGELLERLRRVAVDGVVSEREFLQGARALALNDGETDRLRGELARLGLLVRDLRVHAGDDSHVREKVVRVSGENLSARVVMARALLSRYVDAEGHVTARAVDGVVRLAGLDAREAAQLRADASVLRAADGDAEGAEVGAGADDAEDAERGPMKDGAPPQVVEAPEKAASAAEGDLAHAVAAALAVMEHDRRERRPEKRLLSAEAEVGLAVLVRGGAERVGQEADEEELKALPSDDLRIRARDCLVVHNLRLVHSIVRSHLEQGLDYDDLIQHGALGLMRAARKFDPTMGNKFSTYATWWVRQSLTRAIADEGTLIRIPVHMHEQVRKVAVAERNLAAQGRPATAADVAVACDMTLEKVEQARRLSRRTDSLDRIIGDGATLADFVGERRPLPSVDRQVVRALQTEALFAVLDTFTEREHRILVRRYGLDGEDPSTLDDLGREFGVTRERIRQIEVKLRPVLGERLHAAGLVDADLDAECEKAEHAAERAAEAARAARVARATHAARTARARFALRKARAERLALAAAAKARVAAVPVSTVAAEAIDDVPRGAGATRIETAGTPEGEAATGDERAADAGPAAEAALSTSGAVPRAAEVASPEEEAQAAEVATPADDEDLGSVRQTAEPTASDTGTEPDAFGPAVSTAGTARDADIRGDADSTSAADWELARQMARVPVEQVSWLADYAVAAVGYEGLVALLGQPTADVVMRDAREERRLARPVMTALEVLRSVFDAVVDAGQRPEDFFDRPAQALGGATPRSYLTRRPLVNAESRLATRAALREFAVVRAEATESSTTNGDRDVRVSAEAPAPTRPGEESTDHTSTEQPLDEQVLPTHHSVHTDEPSAQSDPHPLTPRVEHEAELVRVMREHERRLAEERKAADERLTAAQADWERQLDALEDELLLRADRALERRERHVRRQADERVARLRDEHQRAYEALLSRAERAEEAVRRAAGQEERVHTLEQRLREYREGAEARIADLGSRLAEAQADATERQRAAGARVAELETKLRQLEAATAERERAVTLAREEYRLGTQVRIAEAQARLGETEARLQEAEEQLRQTEARLHESETRLRQSETRLREAEAAVAQRDQFVDAARRHAEEAEQQAAQRIAQSGHNAWLRITELQTQLAEAQAQLAATHEAAASHTSFRDRWRRS